MGRAFDMPTGAINKTLAVLGCALIVLQEAVLFSLSSWRKTFALFIEFGFVQGVIGFFSSLFGAVLDLLVAPMTWLGVLFLIIAWRRARLKKVI